MVTMAGLVTAMLYFFGGSVAFLAVLVLFLVQLCVLGAAIACVCTCAVTLRMLRDADEDKLSRIPTTNTTDARESGRISTAENGHDNINNSVSNCDDRKEETEDIDDDDNDDDDNEATGGEVEQIDTVRVARLPPSPSSASSPSSPRVAGSTSTDAGPVRRFSPRVAAALMRVRAHRTAPPSSSSTPPPALNGDSSESGRSSLSSNSTATGSHQSVVERLRHRAQQLHSQHSREEEFSAGDYHSPSEETVTTATSATATALDGIAMSSSKLFRDHDGEVSNNTHESSLIVCTVAELPTKTACSQTALLLYRHRQHDAAGDQATMAGAAATEMLLFQEHAIVKSHGRISHGDGLSAWQLFQGEHRTLEPSEGDHNEEDLPELESAMQALAAHVPTMLMPMLRAAIREAALAPTNACCALWDRARRQITFAIDVDAMPSEMLGNALDALPLYAAQSQDASACRLAWIALPSPEAKLADCRFDGHLQTLVSAPAVLSVLHHGGRSVAEDRPSTASASSSSPSESSATTTYSSDNNNNNNNSGSSSRVHSDKSNSSSRHRHVSSTSPTTVRRPPQLLVSVSHTS